MARTTVGTSDTIAVKKYSAALFKEIIPQSFFLSRFMGEPKSKRPICIMTDLEADAGDAIYVDLFMKAKGQGIEGDNILRGNEEKLVYYSDDVLIDQLRHGIDTGGRMAKKRTVHDLRAIARSMLSGWWAERYDELFFMYLAGSRGDDTTVWVLPDSYSAFAGNTLGASTSTHTVYAGDATSTTDIDANDKMDLTTIDRAIAKAEMLRPLMNPATLDGDQVYVLVMHTYAAYDLQTNTATGQWMDITKFAANRGKDNPVFKGGEYIGRYRNVEMYKHSKVPLHDDWGGSTIAGANNLLLGSQAAVIAYGSPGKAGNRFSWHEEEEDRGNVLVVDTGSIFGIQKLTFNSVDFGAMTICSAAAAP